MAKIDHQYPIGQGLTDARYETILEMLNQPTLAKKNLSKIIRSLHPADIAELLERLQPSQRQLITPLIPSDRLAKTLHELHEDVQEAMLDIVSSAELAEAINHVESDEKADIVGHLEETTHAESSVTENNDASELLIYPEDTAGGLMQVELLALPKTWNVADVLEYIREHNADLPLYLHRIFVVGRNMRHVGSVSLSRLVRQPLEMTLKDIIRTDGITIPHDMPEKEVARTFNKYDVFSCAVVDENNSLLGVVTIDDVLDVVIENQEADALRAAGVDEGSDLFAPLLTTSYQRFPWLFINLLTAILASVVIAQFDGKISEIVALAVLMPIVASMGGNAGTQTMTVTIRGLATKHITPHNGFSLLYKELMAGGFNGLILALLLAIGTTVVYENPSLGGVICAATIINHILAAFAGMTIPVLLKKIGKDPAISSGVLLTTVTDVGGFLAFLGLATVML